MNIKYKKALNMIREGDVLLYKSKSTIGWIIGKATESQYSHVAVASKHNGYFECVEFREGKGGRSVNLKNEVDLHSNNIDVYRPIPYIYKYNFKNNKIRLKVKKLNQKHVTNCMRSLTGLPYGWKRIWWIAKHKLAGFRLFFKMKDLTNDGNGSIVYPICSSACAWAFSQSGFDLVANKGDNWTTPGDIARSPLLSYLFTLEK